MKARIPLHPLAITFMKIADLRFALQNGALSEEEERLVADELRELEAQAKKN